uniref:Nose resistant-to-fluoxetine protein N-terminal domain-containing protein n=1 Tax=Plectus sambesii TaxID=2011161 RepID=A0A914XGG6_9BILA
MRALSLTVILVAISAVAGLRYDQLVAEARRQKAPIQKYHDFVKELLHGFRPNQLLKFVAEADGSRIEEFRAIVAEIQTSVENSASGIQNTICWDEIQYWLASVERWIIAEFKLFVTCSSFPNTTEGNQSKQDCINTYTPIKNDNAFAISQLDAIGKPPTGIMHYNLIWLGAYDECLEIMQPRPSNQTYTARYCSAYVPLGSLTGRSIGFQDGSCPTDSIGAVGQALQWHWCMPAQCSTEDVSNLFRSLSGEFCGASCLERHLAISWRAALVIFVLVVLLVFTLVSTAVDYCIQQPALRKAKSQGKKMPPRSKAFRALMCFSMYTNASEILDTKQKPGSINCIHGIRFISMTWVIMGHVFDSAGGTDNVSELFNFTHYFLHQAIANAYFSVDSFFFISGLLLGFLWFKETKTQSAKQVLSAPKWVMFYFHRYVRLTPVYALVLAAFTTLLPYMTVGPLWQQGTPIITDCEKNFWTNMLYINNLVNTDHMCYSVSWYMANDMQFHLVAPIILITLWYSRLGGILFSCILILISICLNFYSTTHFYLYAENIFGAPKDPRAGADGELNYFQYNYYAPWIRFPPYLIGIIIGMLMQIRYGTKRARIPYLVNAVGWMLATAVAMAAVFGLYHYSQGEMMDVGYRAAYSAFSRPGWALALGWLVFSCHYGYGGPINRFLSWKIWMPLSKLSYCAYLLHVFLYYVMSGTTSTNLHWDGPGSWILLRMVPLVVFSFVASFFISPWLELPFMKLEMVLLKTAPRQRNLVSPVENGANGVKPADAQL